MTALSKRKRRLGFVTEASVRGRAVTVEAFPHTLTLRLKGTRQRYEMSWEGVFWQACKLEAQRQAILRKEACQR